MTDPMSLGLIAAAALAGVTILSMTALRGWTGWLELQRTSLGHAMRGGDARDGGGPSPAARIELADLRERVRKLEAIAAGVDP